MGEVGGSKRGGGDEGGNVVDSGKIGDFVVSNELFLI